MAPLRFRQPPRQPTNLGPLALVAARGPCNGRLDGLEGGCLPKTTLLWGKRHHRCTKEAHAASVAPLRSRQREPLRLSLMGTPPRSLVTAAWTGRRGLDVAFARSEPALRCRVVTGREDMHSVTLESVGAVQISKTTPPRWPLQNTAHILQGWGKRTPNWAMRGPWRLTERRIASGHAPRAQNCPRSRLGRSECLRRPLGAANDAWSVGAAGAKNRKL